MKKKIAAFVLATALVLPTSLTAFAATPSDVAGKPEQSAVEELVALGVLNGYEDGTFKPGNEITRAELAKAAIIASGNESAANILKTVKPTFKDVKANAWYTGYINAAAQKGYIVGYNGNFRPGDTVKFEEVVAILLRALGYKESNLNGSWPYNYLIKADEIGLFTNVSVTPGEKALRGVVAQLVSAAVNEQTVTYNATTGAEVLGNVLVTKIGTPATGILLESAINTTNKTVNINGAKDVADDVIVTGGKKLAELLGHEVSYIVKSGKIVAITDVQAADKVVKGTKDVDQAVGNSTALTVKVGSTVVTKTTVAAGVVSFVNGDVNTALTANDEVELFLDATGAVRFVKATKWNQVDVRVTSIDAKTAYRAARLNVDTNRGTAVAAGVVSVPDTAVVTLNGKVAKIEDLVANDIVSYASNTAGAVKVEATRTAVTGKVEGTTTTNGAPVYTVAGKQYALLTGVAALNVNDSYTLLLNKDGKVADASAPTVTSNSNEVVILKVEAVQVIENDVIASKKKVTYFSIKDNAKQTALLPVLVDDVATPADETEPFAALAVDHVQKFGYTDGKISRVDDVLNLSAGQVAVDSKTDSTLTTDLAGVKTTYQYNSNTVVLKATDLANDNVSVGTIADITKADVIVAKQNGVTLSYVVLKTDNEAVSTTLPAVYGLLVEKVASTVGTTTTYTVKLNVKGEEKVFNITGGVGSAYAAIGTTANQLVALTDTDTTNTLYDTATVAATSTDNGSAVTVDSTNNTFVVDGAPYIASGNTAVYFISTTGVVSVGSFADIVAASTSTGADLTVSVIAGSSSIGTFNQAGLVVVKDN
jgi:hypothetical protein